MISSQNPKNLDISFPHNLSVKISFDNCVQESKISNFISALENFNEFFHEILLDTIIDSLVSSDNSSTLDDQTSSDCSYYSSSPSFIGFENLSMV
ncbi:MAG: hypothetical protein HeimC3_31670 [Candidatus Heimdallarchaeota archaeon LC_3]|nr:MAG: hypothetical protein HeimC3_31670 [Candidatus Heimdallarchaeota archaeon LC_3]